MKDLLGREVPIRSVLMNFSYKLAIASAMPERIFILDGFNPEIFNKE